MDRERGGRSDGRRRLGCEAEVRSSSQSRGFLPGTPRGRASPGTQRLPTFALGYGSPRRGEALSVRYEPHRKPDIRTALSGGRRGEARAPGAGSADRGFVFGVLQRGGVGWLSPVTPRCSTRPEKPSGPSSPSSLPSLEVKGAEPRDAVVAAEPGGGRRAAGRPAAAEARELPGARASCARGAERWRWRRRRAQGQGMTDAPSACAYVRESGKREGACGAQSALPSLSLGSLFPPAPRFPPAPPPFTLPAFPFSAFLSGLCSWEGGKGGGREWGTKSSSWSGDHSVGPILEAT